MTVPAKTSSEPPRPAIRPTSNRSAFCAIQSSCFGAPRQTMRKSGCAAFIFSITGSSSLKYPSFVPQTLSPGYVSCIFSFAASATPGFAPSRNTLLPVCAAYSSIASPISMPGKRSLSGVPIILAAFTTPIPSGITRSALHIASCSSAFSHAAITISGFGVTI